MPWLLVAAGALLNGLNLYFNSLSGSLNQLINQIVGDFDGNGIVNADDIDLLCDQLGGTNPDFDLTGDGDINMLDADALIRDILGTEHGDANLRDGATLADLGIVAANWQTTGPDVGWGDGDFN